MFYSSSLGVFTGNRVLFLVYATAIIYQSLDTYT